VRPAWALPIGCKSRAGGGKPMLVQELLIETNASAFSSRCKIGTCSAVVVREIYIEAMQKRGA